MACLLRYLETAGVGGALTTLSHKEGGANFSFRSNERVTMRNALGLMLMSVVAATLIAAGGWFWTAPSRSTAAPQTVAAARVAPAPAPAAAPAKPTASREAVEVTGSIGERPPQAAAPAPQPKQTCANPNA